MIKRYTTFANLGIGVGLLLSLAPVAVLLAGSGTRFPDASLVSALYAVSLLGRAIFIYGCVMYALAKGRSGWWGAFGLLSLIGLIVLVLLRDDAKDGYVAGQRGFDPILRDDDQRSPPPPLPPRGS